MVTDSLYTDKSINDKLSKLLIRQKNLKELKLRSLELLNLELLNNVPNENLKIFYLYFYDTKFDDNFRNSFSRFRNLEDFTCFINILNNYFFDGITQAINLKQITIICEDLPVLSNKPITNNLSKLNKFRIIFNWII